MDIHRGSSFIARTSGSLDIYNRQVMKNAKKIGLASLLSQLGAHDDLVVRAFL
jgi:hypothetical protein